VRITELDPARHGEDYVAVAHAADREAWPEGLTPPGEYLLNRLVNQSDTRVDRVWLAYDGTGPAGAVEVSWFESEDNRDRAWVEILVPPERFSEDVVSALYDVGTAFMREHGRHVVNADLPQGHPAGKWLESRGATCGSVEQHNVVRLRSLDRADLSALASGRPDGYELVAFDGPCPDDLLEPFTRLVDTMNTAPRDDLTFEDWVYTPERVRDYELGLARRGHTMLNVVARHVATGELAAFNQVVSIPEWPELIENEDTAVAVPHRGHGLGLWIKAVNLQRIVTDFPAAQVVSTWNAASNEHMLRVNRRLGFVCEHVWENWEVSEPQPS
jgi:hypothetical protein